MRSEEAKSVESGRNKTSHQKVLVVCDHDSRAHGSLGSRGHVVIGPTWSSSSHKVLVGIDTQSNVRQIQSIDEGCLVYHSPLRLPFSFH